MQVTVCRWPLKEVTKDKRYIRTKLPLALLECHVDDELPVVRGIAHVRLPGLMGWYDFRVSTGRCTVEAMRDYVLSAESLTALRVARDKAKEKAAKP